jgi:hypothetical protein
MANGKNGNNIGQSGRVAAIAALGGMALAKRRRPTGTPKIVPPLVDSITEVEDTPPIPSHDQAQLQRHLRGLHRRIIGSLHGGTGR